MLKSRFVVSFVGILLSAGPGFAQTPGETATKIAAAGPNDLRILAVNSLRTALVAATPGAEKATGHHIVIEYGTANGNLKDTAMSGQDFELALLTPDANADLAKAGKTAPGITQIATGSMGFALQGDAKADVSSSDGIRKALLGAKAVVFSPNSSGIASVKKMLGELGIEDSIKHINSSGGNVQLAPGEYQIYLYPRSEIVTHQIVTTPAWKDLGPFPAQWQISVIVQAVTGIHARDGVKALMDYLTSPTMSAILTNNGWTR